MIKAKQLGKIAIAVLAGTLPACTAVYQHAAVPAEQRQALPTTLVTERPVAVKRPMLADFLDPKHSSNSPEADLRYRTFAQVKLDWRTKESDRLIKRLRSTELFPQVGYADEIGKEATIEIEWIEGPRSDADSHDAFLFLALGIIPIIERWEWGTYFKRTDRSDIPAFRCDWPVTLVMGWIGPPFSLLPGWSSTQDPAAFEYHLKQCLLEQSGVFTTS